MLRTTNKTVKTALTAHVLENFAETAGYERDNGNSKATPLSCLVSQIDYMRIGSRSIYSTAIDYVEGGSMLVYYDDCRKYLAELLQETPEEAQRFTDDQVWRLYCHLIARTMANLYTEGK